jgi:hypothetical protein
MKKNTFPSLQVFMYGTLWAVNHKQLGCFLQVLNYCSLSKKGQQILTFIAGARSQHLGVGMLPRF